MPRRLPSDPAFRGLLLLTLTAAGCPSKTPPKASHGGDNDTPDALDVVDPPAELPTGTVSGDCEAAPLLDANTELKLAVHADHVAIRVRGEGPIARNQRNRVMAQTGKACASAENARACTTALDEGWGQGALRSDCGQLGCEHLQIAWTGASDAGVVTDVAALLAMLGTIDTSAEARLLAWASRYDTNCPAVPMEDAWELVVTQHMKDCPIQDDTVRLKISQDGTITELERIEGAPGPCIGRLPPDLDGIPGADETVGAWLARAAHLEAAAVEAFAVLAAELTHHGAPAHLIEAVHAAREDEVRHAHIVGDLARRFGCEPEPVEFSKVPLRALVDIAVDNAEEGLGREAWGALVGLWQAQAAGDAEAREVMASVAVDEIHHAELSQAIDAWIRPLLTRNEAMRVDAALSAAWHRLATDAVTPVSSEVQEFLGMPTPAQAERLLAAARESGLVHA